ncbi:MAG: hypothetical protein Q9178_002391 [Gyalolechia marmorata]
MSPYSSDEEDTSDLESPFSNDEHSPANRSPSPSHDLTSTEKATVQQILAVQDSEEREQRMADFIARFARRREPSGDLSSSPPDSPQHSTDEASASPPSTHSPSPPGSLPGSPPGSSPGSPPSSTRDTLDWSPDDSPSP